MGIEGGMHWVPRAAASVAQNEQYAPKGYHQGYAALKFSHRHLPVLELSARARPDFALG
jgi:hypothetical protein